MVLSSNACSGKGVLPGWAPPTLLALILLLSGVVWSWSGGGVLPGYPDLFLYVIPERIFNNRSLSEGFLPFWNPYLFCGTPHAAYLKPAVFYPPSWWVSGTGSSLTLSGVLHGVWAALGFWTWQRCLGSSRGAAFGTALAYGGCGQIVFNWACPAVVASISWIPWVFAAVTRLRESPTAWSAVALALAFAAQILAGYPQVTVWSLIAMVLWLWKGGFPKRSWILLMGALGLAAGTTAAQWLPFLERVLADLRPVWTLDYYSFDPRDLQTLWDPGARWKVLELPEGKTLSTAHFNLYAGWVPLVAALFSILRCRRAESAFWAFLGFAVVVWSLGSGLFGDGTRVFSRWIIQTEPCKASVLTPFALCAATGCLLREMTSPGSETRAGRRWALMLISAWMCVDALATPYRLLNPTRDPFESGEWKTRSEERLRSLGDGRMVADAIAFKDSGQKWSGRSPEMFLQGFLENTNVSASLPSVAGNASFLTVQANSLAALFYGRFPGPGACPDVASCRMAVTARPLAEPWKRAGAGIGSEWRENKNALPRARRALFVRMFPGRGEVLRDLSTSTNEVRDTVWLERAADGSLVGLPKPARGLKTETSRNAKGVSLVREGPNRARVFWTGTSGEVLVWNESFETGWRAWLDGKPVSILRAYGLFQAVGVASAGDHQVDFRYEPGVFRLGLFVSLLSVAVAVFLALNNLLRRKNAPRGADRGAIGGAIEQSKIKNGQR